ncbi:DNA damage-regulated autophagy modulator protein 2-like [Physella acuta]|uniref:DNA damage-regulated autophagy modulator protein 2-like n=1 Tax=Physella acuta TaxID=109671 RepID=UPI0027DCB74C|nr:DNA damage-regulated autophagy modulator protein 2-like [Physella acuta]XP_059177368.1 DNA damage-regulated autophagy modulator protein 2-like [Physella acuta]
MSHLGLLPISLVLLAMITIGVSYIIAVIRNDVSAAFPYISDTGSERPESCIFGQFLNIAAFLAFCTMYVRYKAVEAIAHGSEDDPKLCRLNKCATFFGMVAALGVSMVANFQEGTNVEIVHIIGAGLTFVPGVLYCLVQTALSYHMFPSYNGSYICRIRLALSVVSLLSLILTIVAAVFAIHEWNSKEHTPDKFKWAPDDPGYAAHIVSTSGEWVTAFTFLSFFFTYVQEFNKFELEIRTRPLVRHLDERVETRNRGEINERTKLLDPHI